MTQDEAAALDVVCVGECLVDFLPTRAGERVRDVGAEPVVRDLHVNCSRKRMSESYRRRMSGTP